MDGIEALYQNSAASSETNTAPKKNELGQDEFLSLMLAQLKHQDPMQPMENGEFVAQMAQFSTVSGIESINKSMSELSVALRGNQLMQTSALIGKSALIPGNQLQLTADTPTDIHFNLPEAANSVSISITNQAGELINQFNVDERPAGAHSVPWNGQKVDGSTAPPGDYFASVNYLDETGVASASMLMASKITSVSQNATTNELTVQTESGDSLQLSDISAIKD